MKPLMTTYLFETFNDRAYQWGKKVENKFVVACRKRLQRYLLGEELELTATLARKDASMDPLVPEDTCKKWYTHWEQFGEGPTTTRERVELARQKAAPKGRKGKRKRVRDRPASKMTPVVKAQLIKLVDEDPTAYLDELQSRLEITTGVYVAMKTIWVCLVVDLGWTLGAYSLKAQQQDAGQREDYKQLMERLVKSPNQVMWIDETDKGANASRRKRAWRRRGKRVEISAIFDSNDINRYTMIEAANLSGFVPAACELIQRNKVEGEDDETKGTVDRERFVLYVEKILCPNLGNYDLGEDNSIVVMDNASIHKDPRVEGLINAHGARLVYLPCYSPDLNPIEHMFADYKRYLKRHVPTLGPAIAHMEALNISVGTEKVLNYYRGLDYMRVVPTAAATLTPELLVVLALYIDN